MRLIEMLMAALTVLVVPLALLNFVGGFVGGVWLMILGEWSAFLFGIGLLFVGAFFASFLLMPGMFVAGGAALAMDKGKTGAGWVLLILSSIWTYGVVIAWGVGSFLWFDDRMTSDNAIPLWLWAYGMASGVWGYMASKEPEDSLAPLLVFAAQLGFIVLSACVLWLGWDLADGVRAMLVPFALMAALAVSITISMSRARRSRGW